MSNHLEMAMIHSILALHAQGWSARRIALELGINRETVGRHVAASGPKPATVAANPPPGAGATDAGSEGSKPATVEPNPPLGAAGDSGTLGSMVQTGPPSACEPYRALIEEKLNEGLSGQRIYQDLAAGGVGGGGPSYDSVKRFLRHLRKTTPLPFRRMEAPPGQEMQVDFGTGAPVVGADGRRRRTYVFRIVLSCSRKAYSEAVFRRRAFSARSKILLLLFSRVVDEHSI
jgi:transposase